MRFAAPAVFSGHRKAASGQLTKTVIHQAAEKNRRRIPAALSLFGLRPHLRKLGPPLHSLQLVCVCLIFTPSQPKKTGLGYAVPCGTDRSDYTILTYANQVKFLDLATEFSTLRRKDTKKFYSHKGHRGHRVKLWGTPCGGPGRDLFSFFGFRIHRAGLSAEK